MVTSSSGVDDDIEEWNEQKNEKVADCLHLIWLDRSQGTLPDGGRWSARLLTLFPTYETAVHQRCLVRPSGALLIVQCLKDRDGDEEKSHMQHATHILDVFDSIFIMRVVEPVFSWLCRSTEDGIANGSLHDIESLSNTHRSSYRDETDESKNGVLFRRLILVQRCATDEYD